jgi:alkylation response protein AidB-like acyl-CoA dehydrogenase
VTSSTPDSDAVRAEVRSWLQDNWTPELSLLEWRERVVDAGWARPSWPPEWCGRGLTPGLVDVVNEEFEEFGAVAASGGVGGGLAAPTIFEHGSDALKRRYLRPTLLGDIVWCQLFSEPGSGSDLAGLTTRADRDGDEWVVNGQKVWNTGAHRADYGLLVARTNWDVPKHRGITAFVLPMHQPGIDVRPLRQMNGYASFNEVFMTDARLDADDVIGAVDRGWAVALATLAHERRLQAPGRARRPRRPCRALEEAEREETEASEPHRWYPQRAGRADLVIPRAKATGHDGDAVVRQSAARVISAAWVADWTADRARLARAQGKPPGPEGSLSKLASSGIARMCADAHGHIAGATGMLVGADAPLDGLVTEILVSVPAVSIAGGTDEIQHNILGERILDLPREPSVDRDVPFRDVRRNDGRPTG